MQSTYTVHIPEAMEAVEKISASIHEVQEAVAMVSESIDDLQDELRAVKHAIDGLTRVLNPMHNLSHLERIAERLELLAHRS